MGVDNLVHILDENCGGQQCITTAPVAKSQWRCCGGGGLCQAGFCLRDRHWLLALALSALGQMISVLEAAEVGVPYRLIGRGIPCQ